MVTCGFASALQAEEPVPAAVRFNRDVRPIMSNTCFKCHGPDPKANKADLRLDLPDNARMARKDKTGRTFTPIVPGKPESSEVWRRVSSADQTYVMPPPASLHLLSARDKEIIRKWIEQGAVYEAHWAYSLPKKADPPGGDIKADNPIDRFVLKELEERGIKPSPEADRRTLIRRVSLDVVGLPPSPAEVEAFLADTKPGAYERLVDRLLASPHYGERMAVGWLDLARFADTVGFHGDQLYNNFPYRDWVISAFNRNEPFDQFTRDQIAGDLIPGATTAQRVATGFNRLNMVTREGGAQPKEYLAKYMADRVRTVAATWLGSTMGCAECHDHKFDPFKSRDFYSMGSYFADVKQWGVYEDYDYTPEPELKGFNNDSPFPPEIEVESPYLKSRMERLDARSRDRVAAMATAIAGNPEGAAAAKAWAELVAPRLKADPDGWAVLPVAEAKPKQKGTVHALPDQTARFENPRDPKMYAANDGIVLTVAPEAGPIATLRLEALPDSTSKDRVTNGTKDSFELAFSLEVLRAGQAKAEPVAVADGYPEQATKSFFNGHILTSIVKGWTSPPDMVTQRQSMVYILAQPLTVKAGDKLVATIESEDVAHVRLSASPLGVRVFGDKPRADLAAAVGAAEPTEDQRTLIAAEYFKGTGAGKQAELTALLADVRDVAACRDGRAFTTVTVSVKPYETRILPRGDWQNTSGAVVTPTPPLFLIGGHEPAPGTPRQSRLDLANWLVSRENPLTARTFVNRVWKQFFGTGISAIVDDLGTQGEYPSHPELLDWLAVQFMDDGWDVKSLVRRIVTSATYKQSSTFRTDLAEVDPNNRLLARQSPRRLDAEFVRDNALSAAGLISLDIGGPSVYPYQPEGYYSLLQFPDRDYYPDTDERQYRRGVYVHWQRTFLQPMLANFDAPSREECTASRIVSSTPQQALTLLNDPTFVECSRGLAEEAMAAHPDADFSGRLDDAFSRLFARAPTDRERQALQSFFQGQLAYYQAQPAEAKKLIAIGNHPAPGADDPVRLAAWTSVSRVLLNLNEAIVLY